MEQAHPTACTILYEPNYLLHIKISANVVSQPHTDIYGTSFPPYSFTFFFSFFTLTPVRDFLASFTSYLIWLGQLWCLETPHAHLSR
jgi:hypothetical protein